MTTFRTAPLPFLAIGKKQRRARFQELLFLNWISPWLRKRIKFVPRTSHTNMFGTFEWFAQKKTSELAFVVGDTSGNYELSEIAGRHWLELAIAAIAQERKDFTFLPFGFELGPVRGVDELLAHCDVPLVEVPFEDKPWLVAVTGAKRIVSDTEIGPPAFLDLDAAGRAAVARVWKSKRCECFLCTGLRAKRAPKPPRRK